MTDRDAERFAKVMAALGETFNETISDVRSDAYFAALGDFLIEDVELAATHHIRVGRFFPKPIELREWITGTETDNAEIAWHDVRREIRRVGYTGRPRLPEASLVTLERVFGSWVALCETLPAEGPGLLAWEKRFRETYATLARRNQIALPPSRSVASFPAPAAAGGTRLAEANGKSTTALVGTSRRRSGTRDGAT